MAEKMTAVWLILLTIIVCAAVPAAMIWLTSQPKPEFIFSLELYAGHNFIGI
jgi:hypothetical protein